MAKHVTMNGTMATHVTMNGTMATHVTMNGTMATHVDDGTIATHVTMNTKTARRNSYSVLLILVIEVRAINIIKMVKQIN